MARSRRTWLGALRGVILCAMHENPKSEPRSEQPAGRAAETLGERAGLPPFLKVITVLVMLGAALAFLLFGSQASDAFVYSKLVHEVAAAPDSFRGRELRIEGDLTKGSLRFRERPCEWRFVIEKQGQRIPVRFPQCIVPDTFQDGVGLSVTVQGRLQEDNSFLANQVVPKCPSKYEMKQRFEQGEQMPHPPVGDDLSALRGPTSPY